MYLQTNKSRTPFKGSYITVMGILLMLCMTAIMAGCSGGEARSSQMSDGADGSSQETSDINSVPAEEIVAKYGILVDMTTSVPEEQGIGLVSGIAEAISLPDLPDDISFGMPAVPERQYAIAFVNENPLDTKASQNCYLTWRVPGVAALPPEPDASDPSVTFDVYDKWADEAERYRADYQKCGDAVEEMKAGLRGIDLMAIRETAEGSGIPAAFDQLIRGMSPEDGDVFNVILISDLETNSDVETVPITGIKGNVVGIVTNWGMAETEELVQAFNGFIRADGFNEMMVFRPEATQDAIRQWLAS